MEIDDVLARITQERERFLRTACWTELFGVCYFHVTHLEIKALRAGRRRFPEERTR